MMFRNWCASLLAFGICSAGWCQMPAQGQNTTVPVQQPAATDPREAARQQILQSERWQLAQRDLNQWLSIQQLYSADEVAVLRRQFQSRIARMSPEELQNQLIEMEAKIAVLASPEAEDARRWLAQFLAVQAKYSPEQLRERRPDIAHMTSSQIRQELAKFQQRRGTMQQSQAVTQRGRSLQLQNAQNVQTARQQAEEQARQSAARSAQAAAARNQIQMQTPTEPPFSGPQYNTAPLYTVGPWGNPIRWDARVGFW